MRFTILDYLFTTVIVLIMAAAAGGLVFALRPLVDGLPLEYRGIVTLLLFVLFFFFILGVVYPRILRLISPFKEDAVFSSDDRSLYCFVWKQTVFTYEWTGTILSYVIPVILRGLFYRMLGARVGKGVLVAGKIVEPQMVTIGDYSILGDTSLLMAHAMSQDEVILKRIELGRYVTVGAHAIIMPGVRIGDRSIVAVGSVVSTDTVIPPGEVWAGMPAARIRDVKERELPGLS